MASFLCDPKGTGSSNYCLCGNSPLFNRFGTIVAHQKVAASNATHPNVVFPSWPLFRSENVLLTNQLPVYPRLLNGFPTTPIRILGTCFDFSGRGFQWCGRDHPHLPHALTFSQLVVFFALMIASVVIPPSQPYSLDSTDFRIIIS